MRKIVFYFRDHLSYSTRKSFIIFFIVFLGAWLAVYYSSGIHSWINQPSRSVLAKFSIHFIMYAGVYYAIAFVFCYLHKNPRILSLDFFLKSLSLLILVALGRSLAVHIWLAKQIQPAQLQYFLSRIFWLLKFPAFLLLIFLVLRLRNTNILQYSGLNIRYVEFKPFILALLILIPVILTVSFLPDFIDYYPKYRTSLAVVSSGLPEFLFVIPYEISYGINLFSIEIIYRGLFLFVMIAYLGKGSLYPMVGVYCLIHLGKPVLECISSIAGGYILGVIALYSKSILGGTFVHVGMAWFLELFAWLQNEMRG